MTVSVITGSSTGIGRSTAARLARDGHTVVATMRNPADSDLPDDIDIRALDVTDGEAVEQVFKSILSDYGAVDVLVNNAGIGGGPSVEDADIDQFVRTIETNYLGAIRCTKAVLPSMRERRSGCIVAVTSQGGRISAPLMTPYCGSKFALEAAMEGLAVEVATHGIRVAIIEPGAIITPIWGKVEPRAPEGPYAHLIRRLTSVVMHDVGKGSSADEVADCVAEAIATSAPKLRWLVGQGAERNIRNRQSWSDEEYIEIWNQPDDDGFIKAILAGEPDV
ncbi:MAG TPA: SDR family oxidoreductase [Actinomycetota bacterium]|nr:SDR family oxidoreductase [Actinomycetota bacterium]